MSSNQSADISRLECLLQPHGLVVLGILEGEGFEGFEGNEGLQKVQQLVLIGNAGSSIWPIFFDAPESRDGKADPLDRWSKRIGLAIASELNACAIFPFEGPPWPPVLEWALKAGVAFPSPLSMFIHGKYGLWHAYRFALAMSVPLAGAQPAAAMNSPCLSCTDQPCLQSCPVNAITPDGYQVNDCVDFLSADAASSVPPAHTPLSKFCVKVVPPSVER